MLEQVIFYVLERTIKQYRQFAQNSLDQAGQPITVDQWLVLNVIENSPEAGQSEIAARVFKDQASIARIINLLVKKGFVSQTESQQDRRRIQREITPKGKELISAVRPIVDHYRSTALRGIPEADIVQLRQTLDTIFENCQSAEADEKQ
jgi:DNA-binding MarR family transcriptional regulator